MCHSDVIAPQMAPETTKTQPGPANYQLPGYQTLKAKLAKLAHLAGLSEKAVRKGLCQRPSIKMLKIEAANLAESTHIRPRNRDAQTPPECARN